MLVRSPKSRSCAFMLAGTAVRVRPIKFMVARTASALRVRPLQAASPRSDAVRQQSFSCISSSPLRLSRRPQSPLIIGAADDPAPANPSPREQVCSQPAVGFVRGHRQRAQGSRESPPATTCQRMLGPLVTEFVRNFGREGATPIQRAFNASFLGRVQALKLIRHSAPCRDGGGPLGSSATGGSGDPTPRRRRAKQF
jgi:hypothetical protein